MSTITTNQVMPTPLAPPAVLPFEDGDHMSVAEFIRRWEAMPADVQEKTKRAELIEGVVRMPPISGGSHARPQFSFIGFLNIYTWATPGVLGFDASSIILDPKSMPEPDAILAIDPSCGGRVKLDEKGYIIGAPEWLAEIASSSVSYDLHAKKELYRKFDVKEYVVWRVKEDAIDWFALEGDEFKPLPMVDGVYKSIVFPGLWLAASALIASDFATVRQILDQGLASLQHRAFVEQLRQSKSP
jgi:Uma2 family endonuclease